MSKCKRCGSRVDPDQRGKEFKCPQCEDIKFERKCLEQVEKKVRKNFIETKKREIGCILENLYIYGSYAEQKSLCCDIDFLVTWDKIQLQDYIKKKLSLYSDEFWLNYDLETEEFLTQNVISFLDEVDFWDFRSCEEYPECLNCYEDEGCHGYEENFYSELKNTGIHNYCLLGCDCVDKMSIPDCIFGDKCSFHMFKGEIKTFFKIKVFEMLKDQTDLEFEHSNLNVKVLHLMASNSILEFQENNKELEFRFIKIE